MGRYALDMEKYADLARTMWLESLMRCAPAKILRWMKN